MTITVDIATAAAGLARLIDAAARGDEVLVTRAGRPVARLVALTRPRRRLGSLAGQADIPPDFDAPLPDEVLDAFEGR